ncbi:hypothetical protein CIB43_00874 [Mesomycoplasma hyopneumoniae]|uniref:DUF3137 domain-containing protein n=1 Tax=Mesomycoplasma hyopneumoniae TaxID=2099 RepID=A0A223MBH4_MESHO|nr:hypothetical protein CIB43_00874 [Mesomycoplasma hyopneumoniae]
MENTNSNNILVEIMKKYRLDKYWQRFMLVGFRLKKIDKTFNFFLRIAVMFTLITFVLLFNVLILKNSGTNEENVIFIILYTALSSGLVAFFSSLICFFLKMVYRERKFVFDFNSWSINKMVHQSGFLFENVEKFEILASNNELKIKNISQEYWSVVKEKDLDYVFDDFCFGTMYISTFFKITTSKNIVFYLKHSRIPFGFNVCDNENFLIIDKNFFSENLKITLENKGFKFWREKEEKIYFWSPNLGFNIFEIYSKNNSFLGIIKALGEEMEKKFYQLDQLAKIINNGMIYEENSI